MSNPETEREILRRQGSRPRSREGWGGILRLDSISRSRLGSPNELGLVEPPSPQPSVDRLSVTFATEERSVCSSDTSVRVFVAESLKELPERMEKVRFPTVTDGEDSEEDYSASVTAIMNRRASTRKSRKKGRRTSSPFSHEDGIHSAARRRSSVFTTSSGDTAISLEESLPQEVTQDQIFENIRLHKEVLSNVKMQPWGMRRKIKLVHQAKSYIKRHEGALQERLAQSRSTKDMLARWNILLVQQWQHYKRELANLSNWLIPWESRIKEIESHFGSVVASYFTFLRWLFWVNLIISVVIVAFIAVPQMLTTKKDFLIEDDPKATNLLTLFDFEGVLKQSPLFYGYYTKKDDKVYRLPFAYFMTGLAVYAYSFVATLRKMAANYRMSKLSEKDDECVFSWKLFTGWDYMIGNAETAHNRVASITLSFKEALLEEAEKKRQPRDWKIISIRVLVNLFVIILLGASAWAVVEVVQRSTEPEAKKTLWRRNEITVVMSLISLIFPSFFELLGFLERYHPRKQLRLQLARIMVLNLLNLYSLIFALFDKISDMTRELQSLKPIKNTTGSQTWESMFNASRLFPPQQACLEVLLNCSNYTYPQLTTASLVFALATNVSVVLASKTNISVGSISSISPTLNSLTGHVFTIPMLENVTFLNQENTTWYKIDAPENLIRNDSIRNRNVSVTGDQNNLDYYDYYENETLYENSYEEDKEESKDYYEDTRNDYDIYYEDYFPPNNTNNMSSTLDLVSPSTELQTDSEFNYTYYSAQTMESYNETFMETTISYNETDILNLNESDSTNDTYQTEDYDRTVDYNQTMDYDQAMDYNTTDVTSIYNVSAEPTISTHYTDDYIDASSYTVSAIDDSSSTLDLTSAIDNSSHAAGFVPSTFPYDRSPAGRVPCAPSAGEVVSMPCVRFRCAAREREVARAAKEGNRTRENRLKDLCWETMFGQELVKLTVMDLVFTTMSTLTMDFFRALFVRVMNHCWCWDLEKQFPQYGDFKIAENILHLVNNQGMVWMGMFFSPGLSLINLAKLMVIMYLRSWAVMTCNVPHEVVFRASRSNNFYLALLLTMLFLCVLPVGYAIVWVEPSWHCGPFSTYQRIYHIFTQSLHAAIHKKMHKALDYIASPGIVIPLLVLLVLIIYYLISLTNSLREANNDLKFQLRRERTEERRKMFQIADRRRRQGSGDSGEFDNTPFGKWKKLLPMLPNTKSFDGDVSKENEPEEPKNENKNKDFLVKFIKRALKKSPAAEEEAHRSDEGTDNELHESLPDDSKKEVKEKKSIGSFKKLAAAVKKQAQVEKQPAPDAPYTEKTRKEKTESVTVTKETRGPKARDKQRDKNRSPSKSSSSREIRQDSISSVWSDNIPVITISKTESSECILEQQGETSPASATRKKKNKIVHQQHVDIESKMDDGPRTAGNETLVRVEEEELDVKIRYEDEDERYFRKGKSAPGKRISSADTAQSVEL